MRKEAENYLRTLDRSDNTKAAYKWALSCFERAVGDDAPLDIATYEKFLQSIAKRSPSTKRIFKSAARGLYSFCDVLDPKMERLENHYIARTQKTILQFDRQAVEKIIDYCSTLRGSLTNLRDRAFVLTLADSGMRISEICSLRRIDINRQEQRAIITGKGNKQAVVRFSNRSLAAIDDYLNARMRLDGATGKPLGSLPLFAQHGKQARKKTVRIAPCGMRRAIKDRMDEAGVDHQTVRIHDFRHYFVTIVMIDSGGNLKLAQELARHESVQTTQRYAHLVTSELDDSYDRIFNPPPLHESVK